MSTTIEQIAEYFDKRDWKYVTRPEKSQIVAGFKSENVEDLCVVISLKENGEYLEMAVPNLVKVKEHVYKGILFQALLSISWQSKMIRWEYDLTDGEIRASIAFPLEDAPLTEKQFLRVVTGLVEIVDSVAMPRIKSVLETGIDPAKKAMADKLLQNLQEMGYLELIQEAIAERELPD